MGVDELPRRGGGVSKGRKRTGPGVSSKTRHRKRRFLREAGRERCKERHTVEEVEKKQTARKVRRRTRKRGPSRTVEATLKRRGAEDQNRGDSGERLLLGPRKKNLCYRQGTPHKKKRRGVRRTNGAFPLEEKKKKHRGVFKGYWQWGASGSERVLA